MNAALKTLSAALARGGQHLGDIVFWSLGAASINRLDLESRWEQTGLPITLLPEPPTLEKAFKLAVRETHAGLTERLIRPLIDDEAHVVFAVVHEARHNEVLVYTQEARIELNLLHGDIVSDVPAHDLVVAVKARFAALRDAHAPDDIRRTITRTLQRLSAVLLRDSGAIWYVPAPHAAALRQLQGCIEGIGHSKLYLLPVHDTADGSRTLGDAATKSLEAELTDLKSEVEAFVAQPPERTSTLVRRFDAFDDLRARAELYRSVLSVQVKDLDTTLDQLESSIETLLNAKQAA